MPHIGCRTYELVRNVRRAFTYRIDPTVKRAHALERLTVLQPGANRAGSPPSVNPVDVMPAEIGMENGAGQLSTELSGGQQRTAVGRALMAQPASSSPTS